MNYRYLAFLSFLALVGCKEEGTRESVALDTKSTGVESSAAGQDVSTLSVESVEEVPSFKEMFQTKVRDVIGRADFAKKKDYEIWKPVRCGLRIVQDDKIRVDEDSEVTLVALDGTTFSIQEKSLVTISADFIDDIEKLKQITLNIDKGSIQFDVQKQKKNKYLFKTHTATASIRGTAGFVGSANGQMVASLKEGEVEVTGSDGKSTNIVQNQTLLIGEDGKSKTLNLTSSGTKALTAAFTELMEKPDGMTNLEKSLKKFDGGYKNRKAAFEKKLKFLATEVEKEVHEPTITLLAKVTPGVIVEVHGDADTVGADGIYKKTITWDSEAFGSKRFMASCGDGFVEVPCYVWNVEYTDKESSDQSVAADTSKFSVKIDGPRTEVIHLDSPSISHFADMKIRLKGIAEQDLMKIKNIVIRRSGEVVETISEAGLNSLVYEREMQVSLNTIADIEVFVNLKNGKTYRARKTYEVYCLRDRHSEELKDSLALKDSLSKEVEYEMVKAEGLLVND